MGITIWTWIYDSIHGCYSIHSTTFIVHLVQDNPLSGDAGEPARFASKLLRRLSERISNAIVSPDVLAEKLYMKQFISHSVYQAANSHDKRAKDRSRELLDDISDAILLKSIKFEDFLKALKELPQGGAVLAVITSLQAEHSKISCNKLAQSSIDFEFINSCCDCCYSLCMNRTVRICHGFTCRLKLRHYTCIRPPWKITLFWVTLLKI